MGRTRHRRGAGLLLAVALATTMVGCTADPLAEQYRAGQNTGFIAGDGRIVEIPVDQRGPAVEFSATTETGETVTSDDYRGDVLVVNFWYAACGPCRAEASDLEDAYVTFADDGVAFLGVNTQDSAAAAIAFAETYGVTYPSALAAEDGALKRAFARVAPLSATPVTLVIDGEGRVAARIIGQLPDASILKTLVRDALEQA